MSEIKTVVDGDQIQYEGLIDLKGLYRMIDKWFSVRGFDKMETKNYEEVYEEGKQVTLEIIPYKKITDYVKIEIKVTGYFTHLNDVEIEKNGAKLHLVKGKASIIFDAYHTTDYEGTWETRAVFHFFRTLFDKFIYKQYSEASEAAAKQHCTDLKNEVKSFLNMYRYHQ
ncbi:hypothetical protein CMO92_01900 [Candidatus Woesearchaeota archaeon]|nr:hypothetical protein [Candidatus Woesearchaeota archaeon]|tara:strand:- start:185 stop:691 length:507 start_codon:yes stop_codon:yes gene_type:complete